MYPFCPINACPAAPRLLPVGWCCRWALFVFWAALVAALSSGAGGGGGAAARGAQAERRRAAITMEGGERGRTAQRAERGGKPKPRASQAERLRSDGELAKGAEPPPPGRS